MDHSVQSDDDGPPSGSPSGDELSSKEKKRPGISSAFFDRYNPRGALAKRANSQIGRTITAPSRK
jgi:hypothetical protein